MSTGAAQPLKVLLVEDNPADADFTRETLEASRPDLEIATVVDGAEAIAYLLREPPFEGVGAPDLILLDLNLPKVSGQQVLAEVRRHESLRRTPVVVLTSSDADRDVTKSYELGANCYLTKPVGLEAFRAIVRLVERFWLAAVELP